MKSDNMMEAFEVCDLEESIAVSGGGDSVEAIIMVIAVAAVVAAISI